MRCHFASKSYTRPENPSEQRQSVDKEDEVVRVPESQRAEWTNNSRGAFIREWHDRGYKTPALPWEAYDIHHIKPLEFGGTNNFDNLTPVIRQVHQQKFTPWWNSYAR